MSTVILSHKFTKHHFIQITYSCVYVGFNCLHYIVYYNMSRPVYIICTYNMYIYMHMLMWAIDFIRLTDFTDTGTSPSSNTILSIHSGIDAANCEKPKLWVLINCRL